MEDLFEETNQLFIHRLMKYRFCLESESKRFERPFVLSKHCVATAYDELFPPHDTVHGPLIRF